MILIKRAAKARIYLDKKYNIKEKIHRENYKQKNTPRSEPAKDKKVSSFLPI